MMWYGDMDCWNEKFYFVDEITVPPLGNQFNGSTFFVDLSDGWFSNGYLMANVEKGGEGRHLLG